MVMNNRFILLSFLFVGVFSLQCAIVKSSKATTTIILLRHAEKDTTDKGNNPPLSAEGKARAKRLSASFPNVVPDEFYSTPYTRTSEALKPWADALEKEVKTYSIGNSVEFAEELLKQKGKTIVISGHSNTIPALVNLLIGTEKYQILSDSTYSNIYVITIKNGKAKEKVIHY